MSLQLYALANGQRWAGVKKRVDFFVGGDESPVSAKFSYTPRNDSPVVKDKESDPDCRNRNNRHGNAHN